MDVTTPVTFSPVFKVLIDSSSSSAKDFSIGFLQRRFLIRVGTAVKLRDKLLFDKKITRVFLAGDVLCKG